MSADTTVRDSATMLRRNLRHIRRYPSLSIMLLAQPIVLLVIFVYVFGATMGGGLPGGEGGDERTTYLVFITPAILLMTVTSVALGTAIATATDMSTGIIARFRTMDIARVSVLTGHVLGALIKTVAALVVVTAFAFLIGFRTDAGPFGWLGALGLLTLLALALTWLTVGMGLAADSVETASNTPMFLMLLPFISSGFVPTETLPWGVRQFAEYQPFTPVIEALRALVGGTPPGSSLWLAIGWCVLIAVAAYLWSRRLYLRVPAR
jgi:ABC-2 type transport system permease protein